MNKKRIYVIAIGVFNYFIKATKDNKDHNLSLSVFRDAIKEKLKSIIKKEFDFALFCLFIYLFIYFIIEH